MTHLATSICPRRLRSVSVMLCLVAAVPLVAKAEGRAAPAGARTAFQLLEFKPGKECTRASPAPMAVSGPPSTAS